MNAAAEVWMIMLTAGSGRKVKSVSQGLIEIMKARAPSGVDQVLAEYMIAGPSSMRTAFRSLVARAIMSPVRLRW